ncbi:restriction endonuclease subunit S [Enterococcus avium]|nr:restriction endonuclease subunit S [Enterococcus avium]MDB1747945.1 restriction endonuclease subunit S [Enterococcus avium]MDB1752085.1 restriction endonuclease subunit S [Enterococcus avium]MDB1759132.1 restriction endonuclease subunit S [Enterococcus avium]
MRKFSGVIEKLSGGASIKPTDYLEDGIRTIPKGAVNATGIADLSGSKYISKDFFEKNITSHVHTNNLVTSLRDLVPSAPNMGRIVRIEGDDEQFLMPQGVYKLELLEGMDEDFLISFSNSDKYRKIISAEKKGSTQVHIRNGEFLNIDINLPSEHEQNKIGDFFKSLNHTLALHQRKLDLLKRLKQAYLQKMFPKNGEKVPEIRFADFDEVWEQRKLGELGSVAMNKRIFKEQTSDNGDVPFFKIGTFGSKADAFITHELFEEYKAKYPYPKIGDLLISASGSIGRVVEYTGKDEYFQDSNIVWLNHDDRIENSFLKQFYTIVKWQGLEGSTIKRLYNKNILETKISIPDSNEQQQIGFFFKQLDDIIALHREKNEAFKKMKTAFLSKMFI